VEEVIEQIVIVQGLHHLVGAIQENPLSLGVHPADPLFDPGRRRDSQAGNHGAFP
jgi:hypothetical protein